MLAASLTFLPTEITRASESSMTFTTGETIVFHSPVEMQFWSNILMTFSSGNKMQFLDIDMDGVIMPCDWIRIVWPVGYLPPLCSWWEVLDPLGIPLGEIHIDGADPPYEVHVDLVLPAQGFQIPLGITLTAVKKIEVVEPCEYYVVEEPPHWYPPVCSWWEIMDPETGHPTGYEFHVDWNNASCEFHVDDVIPRPYVPPFPAYEIEARRKIDTITSCDWFVMLDPAGFTPEPCSWWEIMYQGEPTGLEFHVDQAQGGAFHVDQVEPSPLKIPPTYPTIARKKVDVIQQCDWFKVDDPTLTPEPCTWWRIIDPNIGDVEFHVDISEPDGTFHVDIVDPVATLSPPLYELVAEQKFTGILPCDWFTVIDPPGFIPQPCSWWRVTSPIEWAGVRFHVDSTDGISSFHCDLVDQLPPGPIPPPWNVTAIYFEDEYYKPGYPDYAPSGMPDFNQMQDNWINPLVGWTWCGPVSAANSLWWLDSEFEPNQVPPPTISDSFPLVTSYGPGLWDDHDPQNVIPLVNNLAFLMDTDGQRTGLPHTGTSFVDMQTGISQYLQQHGVNPIGDCDGDGDIDNADIAIVTAAMGSIPGGPRWNMAADVYIDNAINVYDMATVAGGFGRTGLFYEHTTEFPAFNYIRNEILACEDVVLLLEVWNEVAPGIWQKWVYDPGGEAGHYVTCAGVGTITDVVKISDPWQDACEAGLTPGRVPVPHPYPHPPGLHNDAQLVSHDEYPVILPPMSPYLGIPILELLGYPQTWGLPPTWHAFIRAAVVTSPLIVAATNIRVCYDQTNLAQNRTHHINVTVTNKGLLPYTSTLTVYWNTTNVIGSTSVSLTGGETKVVTIPWVANQGRYSSYLISAVATTVPVKHIIGNTFTGPIVQIVWPGDVDGDRQVGILDVVKITGIYAVKYPNPQYKANSDIDCDGSITILDVVLCTGQYAHSEP